MADQNTPQLRLLQSTIKEALALLYAVNRAIMRPGLTVEQTHSTLLEMDQKLSPLREHLQEMAQDFVGNCLECDKPLFSGDEGYGYSDYDPVTCAEHAPTWREIKEMLAAGGFEEPEHMRKRSAEQEAAGKLDERCTHEL